MARIIRAPAAEADAVEIWAYIAEDNPAAASERRSMIHPPPLLTRILKTALRTLLIIALAIITPLLLFQSKLIYHPRHYTVEAAARNPDLIPLAYTTSQGAQQSYYLPPQNPQDQQHQPPRHLWVLFAGNGSLALDWLYFLDPAPDPRDGYLLIEYPGYGACQGSPSPKAIQESAEAAFASLADLLHTKPAALDGNVNLLCLSIGCGAGLNFAIHHPVDRIVLLAPFTCMRDMARRVVGWPLCWLLLHNFDNNARLAELASRAHPPCVTIFHGEEDQTIPISMGRRLASGYPAMITFQAVPGAGHNTVLGASVSQISALMRP